TVLFSGRKVTRYFLVGGFTLAGAIYGLTPPMSAVLSGNRGNRTYCIRFRGGAYPPCQNPFRRDPSLRGERLRALPSRTRVAAKRGFLLALLLLLPPQQHHDGRRRLEIGADDQLVGVQHPLHVRLPVQELVRRQQVLERQGAVVNRQDVHAR